MGIITNTFTTATPKGNREELSNVVSRITPEDTPIYSSIRKKMCSTIHPEWETDTLEAPAENAQLEGDEYSFEAITPSVRVGNYTQIFRKGVVVSGTQESVDNAGDYEKYKMQMLKKGVVLRKDIEFALTTPKLTVKGQTRFFGSLPTWITTNALRGADGVDGGFVQATGLTSLPTKGTQRAFTKILLDGVLKSCYEAGANPKLLVCSSYVKGVFVQFMSDTNVAAFRYATSKSKKNTIVGTADVYEGPYGTVTIVPNRVMSNAANSRQVYTLDTTYLEWCWLKGRKMKNVQKLAVTGDNKKGIIIGEGTLKVRNEAGIGVIDDCFGLTAAS